MQATTLSLPPPSLPHGLTKPPVALPLPWFPKQQKLSTSRPLQLKLKPTAAATNDTAPTTVDYSSGTSVFPAEACETVGGEACDAEMYPEVKPLPSQPRNSDSAAAEESVDREYLQYDEPKTVFPAEACDDLGGEFCEPDYQTGVY